MLFSNWYKSDFSLLLSLLLPFTVIYPSFLGHFFLLLPLDSSSFLFPLIPVRLPNTLALRGGIDISEPIRRRLRGSSFDQRGRHISMYTSALSGSALAKPPACQRPTRSFTQVRQKALVDPLNLNH